MDLEELKQKWNRIDEEMSKSEVYNRRVLIETIKSKTKTTFEQLQRGAIFNLFVTLLVATVVVPLCHMEGIYHNTDFYLLEAICVLGLLMVTCRLFILSHFNVMKSPVEQLHHLADYKRCYVYEVAIGLPLAIFGICVVLYLEHTATPLGLFFVGLVVFAGLVFGWFGWKKHKAMMQEIEHHLAELHEFEEEQES